MKLLSQLTITTLSVYSLNAQTSSEELFCSGSCADAITNAINNDGGDSADIVEIPAGRGLGRSGANSQNSYLLTTKGGSSRIFSTIAKPQEVVIDNQSSASRGPSTRFGLVFTLPVINNYGCWCYGGASWPGARDVTGTGPAKDDYDDACKAHHMGFDCITLDAAAEGESCQPNEEQYSLLVKPLPSGDYTLECADSIADHWCKRRTCMVDLRFIARHWKLEEDGVEPDYASFGHPGHHNNQGNFDTSECVIDEPKGPGGHNGNGKGDLPVQKVCCGDYPYRIWYNKNNDRGINCCAYEDPAITNDYGFSLKIGKLYNSAAATCCANGIETDSNVCQD